MEAMSCAWSGGWYAEEVVSPAGDDPRIASVSLVLVGRSLITSGSGARGCANGLLVIDAAGVRHGVFFNRPDGGMKVVPCR
jgi:hypothetical protein